MRCCTICLQLTDSIYCSHECESIDWELVSLEEKHESELTESERVRMSQLGKTIEVLRIVRRAQ